MKVALSEFGVYNVFPQSDCRSAVVWSRWLLDSWALQAWALHLLT